MPAVSVTAFHHFVVMYNMGGRHSGERVGQAFCNAFGITDNELFYEEDEKEAWKKTEKYLTAPES